MYRVQIRPHRVSTFLDNLRFSGFSCTSFRYGFGNASYGSGFWIDSVHCYLPARKSVPFHYAVFCLWICLGSMICMSCAQSTSSIPTPFACLSLSVLPRIVWYTLFCGKLPRNYRFAAFSSSRRQGRGKPRQQHRRDAVPPRFLSLCT